MRAWAIGVWAVLGWTACSSDPSVYLSPPPFSAARSALLVLSSQTPPVGPLLLAFDLDADPTLAFDLPADVLPGPSLSLYVAYYTRTLADEGFQAGLVELASGQQASRGLPASAQIFHTVLTPVPGEWERAFLPAELASLRLADHRNPGDICSSFEIKRVSLGKSAELGPITLATTLDARHAFVATGNRYFSIAVDGIEELGTLDASLPRTAGFQSADGDVWLLAPGFARGTPARGFERLEAPTSTAGEWAIDGRSDAGGAEIFASSSDFSFWRFDGSHWQVLDRGTTRDTYTPHGTLAAVGPGEAFVIGTYDVGFVEYKDGVVRRDDFQIDDSDPPRAAGFAPGYGRIIGTGRGRLFRSLERADWESLSGDQIAMLVIRSIAPYRDGLLLGGNDGLVNQFYQGFGFCETIPIGTGGVRGFVPLEDGVLVAADAGAGRDDVEVVWLFER